MDDRPIGIFDSGVGGLTVAEKVFRLLPRERVVYFGDTARVPYGNKSLAALRVFASEDAAFLMQHDVKAIVVACNTIAAVALEYLRERFPVPIFGVVCAGARRAVEVTRTKRIGVIGTRVTIHSGAFVRAIKARMPDAVVHSVACPLFVPLIEEGWTDHPVADAVIAEYLGGLRTRDIDTLVLGCSHYPLLAPAIARYLGPAVTLVEAGEVSVLELRGQLEGAGALRESEGRPEHRFYVSDLSPNFHLIAASFINGGISRVEEVSPEAISAAARQRLQRGDAAL